MASLTQLLSTRQKAYDLANKSDETNVDRGKVFIYCSGREYNDFVYGFCWQAPNSGKAFVEHWGAGGSVGCQCCCNHSMPGESGAYVGICICFDGTANNYVCGLTGHPCTTNSGGFCWAGCSSATCTTICNGDSGTCWCICAQGGTAGLHWCHTGNAHICCAIARNYCITGGWNFQVGGTGNGCGWACGRSSQFTPGCAYVYKAGDEAYNDPDVQWDHTRYSCVQTWTCNVSTGSPEYNNHASARPKGLFTKGQTIAFANFKSNGNGSVTGAYTSGQGAIESNWMGAAISHNSPSTQNGMLGCWTSMQRCNCYEGDACIPFTPAGSGAPYAQGCPDVRNVGHRGGLGMVRIKFVSDTDTYQ